MSQSDLVVTSSRLAGGRVFKVFNGRAEIENRIKEGKNTLKNTLCWDKISCQRFEANQARLKMGLLAYTLLHMIRQFYVLGEEVKRSVELLIKRLIKVGARISYHARRWYVHEPLLFRWRTTAVGCWPGVRRPQIYAVSVTNGEILPKSEETILF